MSKGLKIVNYLLSQHINENGQHIIYDDELKVIEKALKALEIIKEKRVDVFVVEKCKSVREYNEDLREEYRLTKREFDLLKGWLK